MKSVYKELGVLVVVIRQFQMLCVIHLPPLIHT
jgi:hypothetical protein